MTVKRILVAIDFSHTSLQAMEAAIDLAEETGAFLQILHVWEAPSFLGPRLLAHIAGSDRHSELRHAYEEAGRALHHLIETSGARERVHLEPDLEVGTPWRTICEIAEKGGHDLIVIGTRGRNSLSHAVTGSVAEQVVRHAPCPVLTVRDRRRAAV